MSENVKRSERQRDFIPDVDEHGRPIPTSIEKMILNAKNLEVDDLKGQTSVLRKENDLLKIQNEILKMRLEAKQVAQLKPSVKKTTTSYTSIKDALTGVLGAFGSILWFLLSIVIAALPFVILGFPFWGILLAYFVFSIPVIGQLANLGLYIWAFTEAITQKQDVFVIAFYVVFAVNMLNILLSLISGKSRD